MLFDRRAGPLSEPMTGRHWDRQTVLREFARRVNYFRDHGLEPLDRVFVHYGNNLEFFVDLLAVWALGGCIIPIDARLTEFEVETLARAARPRFSLWHGTPNGTLIGPLSELGARILETPTEDPGGDPRPPHLSSTQPALDQDALILFTSGTTGQPKGVVHTHRSLLARWVTLQQALGLDRFRRTLCLLPTHFGHGLICNCLFPWLGGQQLHLVPPFRADILVQLGTLLEEHEISFMSSVPSVWRVVLKMAQPPKSGTLECVFCGSAPLSALLWQDIRDWCGTEEVLNSYGITETGSWVAGTTVPGFTPEDGMIGYAWGAVIRVLKSADTGTPPGLAEECKTGEEGYVWLNTPALMKGYFERDDLTREVVSQGWFMTGDVGLLDERGVLYLRGRVREEINKGGMKVHPADIDAVVERLEGVKDACSFGFEDPLFGEDVAIALVLEDPSDENVLELQALTRKQLAAHKVPVRWYVLDAIPRTSRGKVNRSHVAERCADRQALALGSGRRKEE
jgi:acyl-CoA synthetase (AMP-forming)/AMP-acid ligase II